MRSGVGMGVGGGGGGGGWICFDHGVREGRRWEWVQSWVGRGRSSALGAVFVCLLFIEFDCCHLNGPLQDLYNRTRDSFHQRPLTATLPLTPTPSHPLSSYRSRLDFLGFCVALRYALTCSTLCLVSMDGRPQWKCPLLLGKA